MNKNNKWSISYSWTQPYTNWNHSTTLTNQQLTVINAIDNIVSDMESYPDTKRLLKNIFKSI